MFEKDYIGIYKQENTTIDAFIWDNLSRTEKGWFDWEDWDYVKKLASDITKVKATKIFGWLECMKDNCHKFMHPLP